MLTYELPRLPNLPPRRCLSCYLFLAYALLNHEGEPKPSEADLAADRPFRDNIRLLESIRPDWIDGKQDPAATDEMVHLLRTASAAESSKLVVELLNRGASPDSIFDGFFAAAAELLMRQTAIIALHAMTTTNAMHYLYRLAGDDKTRRLILLQNAAFLSLFREAAVGRGMLGEQRIDELTASPDFSLSDDSLTDVFATLGDSKANVAAKALSYLEQGGDVPSLVRRARQLVFLKGSDSHDYKYSSAVLEDYFAIHPTWRNRYLAAACYNLRHSQENDTDLSKRIRAVVST